MIILGQTSPVFPSWENIKQILLNFGVHVKITSIRAPAGRRGEVFPRKTVAKWMKNSVLMYSARSTKEYTSDSARSFKIIREGIFVL